MNTSPFRLSEINAPSASERDVFSSWKEIAAYLGKGIRTVQRWERQAELPIRRPSNSCNRILAFRSELNDWIVASNSKQPVKTKDEMIAQLESQLAQARAEIARLHLELALLLEPRERHNHQSRPEVA